MLREFSPDVIQGQITVTRNLPQRRPRPGERRKAA
jgi:hypothetical protein